MTDWNPRYLAYARAHGRSPEQMLAYDGKRFPGGKMCGFMLWIGEHWSEWREKNRVHRDAVLAPADHADFDAGIGAV